MNQRSIVLAVLGVFLVILPAACGGDDSGPAPTASPSAAASTATSSVPATATLPPAPTETSTSAANPSPTPAPSPRPTLPSAQPLVIEHGSRDSNAIALTFDMGGRVDPALDIMQFLVDNDVRATIFMTGAMAENANTDAGRQVLQTICERDDLFEPGNHSYSHPDFRELSEAEMAAELATTEDGMAAVCPNTPRPLFRPPFGGVDDRVAGIVAANGYPLVIMWDVDTIDWRPESEGGPTAADISNKVLANARGGSIVLMHLGGYNTLDALAAIVAGLRDRGFELARVSEVLAAGQ